MKLAKEETELLSCVSRLIRLLEDETRRLRAMRPKEVESLQTKKDALVDEYRKKLKALTERRAGSGGAAVAGAVASATRKELAAAAQALQTATRENEVALRAAKLATDQLVRSIAAAVLEEQRVREHYHADGRSSAAGAAGKAVAVSINEVL